MWDEAQFLMQQKTIQQTNCCLQNWIVTIILAQTTWKSSAFSEKPTRLQESQLTEALNICSSFFAWSWWPCSEGWEHIISAVEALNLAVLALTIWTLSRGNVLLWLTGIINSAQWLVMPLVIKQVSESGRRGLNRIKIHRVPTACHPRSVTCLCLQPAMYI